MQLLQELLVILSERLTSPHVLDRKDITVIMNLVTKKFGIPRDIESDIGLCLLSQVVFSIAASADVSDKEIGDYLAKIDHNNRMPRKFNDLGQTIKFFNSTPIQIGEKIIQFTLNAHKITDKAGIIKELKSGQSVICALPSNGAITSLMVRMENNGKSVPHFLKNNTKQMKADFKNGIISVDLIKRIEEIGSFNTGMFHTVLIFGYDAATKMFLMRDSRNIYSKNGYFKVAEEFFTSENIGPKKEIGGMFYVEVIDAKEVDSLEQAGTTKPRPVKKSKRSSSSDSDWG